MSPASHPTLTSISTSSTNMKRAPSPPNTNHHCSFSPSPLSSPSLLPSPTSSSSSYFSPSYHQPTTFSSNDDRPPAPERRRSSGGGQGFPRSQPLRPMLGLTSLTGGATAPSEKPQLIPINGMKAGPGKGKVKMLVGRTMKSTFELNLNCRELSRAE